MSKEELRKRLRARIEEKKIQRSSKKNKEKVLETTMGEHGVDMKELEKSMKILQKQGLNDFSKEGVEKFMKNLYGMKDEKEYENFLKNILSK